MRTLAAFALVTAACGTSVAEEKEPFAARTTTFHIPARHTPEGTGTVKPYSRLAIGGITPHQAGGYVGGGRLVHGDGPGVQDGTFGWDYVGFGRRPGRVFLGYFHDAPTHQMAFLPKYNAEGRRVTDVVALMPVKKAIREAKHEKKTGGGEGHE